MTPTSRVTTEVSFHLDASPFAFIVASALTAAPLLFAAAQSKSLNARSFSGANVLDRILLLKSLILFLSSVQTLLKIFG